MQYHLVFITVIVSTLLADAADVTFQPHADAAATQLLPSGKYWKPSAKTGCPYPFPGWQAANVLSTLANIGILQGGHKAALVQDVFDEAFTQSGGVQNDDTHYDDLGWWALALVRGARLLGIPGNASVVGLPSSRAERAQDFIGTAVNIFDLYVERAWDSTSCGGGVMWGPAKPGTGYKNAITNQLFFSLAAALHEAIGNGSSTRFLEWSLKAWAWLDSSAMRNRTSGLFNDGLTRDCRNNNQTTWTYNQGVVLGGLASLFRATGNQTFLRQADAIARAAMKNLASNATGVLEEPCESTKSGCSSTGVIFKGVFVRNLWYLSAVAEPQDAASYLEFLLVNAASAVQHGSDGNDTFALHWAGPFSEDKDVDKSPAMAQAAALDLLVAAGWTAPAVESHPIPPRVCSLDSDPVGAWTRPGWRCVGDSGELLPRGRGLEDCQLACEGSTKCAYYTWTKHRKWYGKVDNICNYFGAVTTMNSASTTSATSSGSSGTVVSCSSNMANCDAAGSGGCIYVSGSRACRSAP